MIIYMYYVINM